MNWWLSLALLVTVTWYIWADNFPLVAVYSGRGKETEKVALLAAIPVVCLVWGMVIA